MIKLKLKSEIILSNYWMSKEEWKETYKDNLPALKELILEDISAFLEDCGDIDDLIIDAEWIDNEKECPDCSGTGTIPTNSIACSHVPCPTCYDDINKRLKIKE